MRYCVSLLGILLISATLAFAGPTLGVKAGLNFANVRVTTPVDVEESTYDTRTGMIAGVFTELPVPRISHLSLRGELLYVQKGTEVGFLGEHSTVKVDEITVSAYAVYYLLNSTAIRPFVEIAPEVGLNTTDKTVSEHGDSFDSGGSWSSTDFSLSLGAGIRFPLSARYLTVEARYSDGVKNMGTWIPKYIAGTKTWTNGFQLLIGYTLIKLP